MCGRFTLRTPARAVAHALGRQHLASDLAATESQLAQLSLFEPRYNLAPMQRLPAVRLVDGQRQVVSLSWGLVPSWADDPTIGNRMINARAETVADKPAYRQAFQKSRCLIPADGFYEWKKAGKTKQPYFVHFADDRPFAFAGLAANWERGELTIDSCTIITTEPNELMAGIHDRMPVILSPEDYGIWLDPQFEGREKLISLLRPYPAGEMTAATVSTFVNSPMNESAACLQPAERREPRGLFD